MISRGLTVRFISVWSVSNFFWVQLLGEMKCFFNFPYSYVFYQNAELIFLGSSRKKM